MSICSLLAALLYGAETWTVYSMQTDRLQANVMRHLRSIICISWTDKITNVEVGPTKESRVAVPKVHTYLDEPKMAWPCRKDGFIEWSAL